MTRADIGKAEIPAAPTIGLTFLSFGRKRLRIFAVMTPEEVEDLRRDDAARGVEDEGDEAHADDGERAEVDELVAGHSGGDREAEEYRHDVGHFVLRGLREALGDAADAEHVAEHDEAEQRDGGRRDEAADYRYRYREEEELGLGDGTRRACASCALSQS